MSEWEDANNSSYDDDEDEGLPSWMRADTTVLSGKLSKSAENMQVPGAPPGTPSAKPEVKSKERPPRSEPPKVASTRTVTTISEPQQSAKDVQADFSAPPELPAQPIVTPPTEDHRGTDRRSTRWRLPAHMEQRSYIDRRNNGAGHKKATHHHRSKKKKAFTLETRFILDMGLLTVAAFVLLRYIPGSFLIQIEWAIGNQLIRMGILVLLLAFMVFSFVIRRWLRGAGTLAVAGILVWEIVTMVPFHTAKVNIDQDTPTLKVATLNTAITWPGAFLRYLSDESIDIASIQELYALHVDSVIIEARKLGYEAVFTQLRDDAGMGVLLLSKGRIDTVKTLLMDSFDDGWRQILVADVKVNGGKVRVIPVHLESNNRQRFGLMRGLIVSAGLRANQAQTIASVVDTTNMPTIVMGDMNATPTERIVKYLQDPLEDAWLTAGVGLGGTWTRSRPIFRIDQVLSRGFAGAQNASVIDSIATGDHAAYRVDLVIPPQ